MGLGPRASEREYEEEEGEAKGKGEGCPGSALDVRKVIMYDPAKRSKEARDRGIPDSNSRRVQLGGLCMDVRGRANAEPPACLFCPLEQIQATPMNSESCKPRNPYTVRLRSKQIPKKKRKKQPRGDKSNKTQDEERDQKREIAVIILLDSRRYIPCSLRPVGIQRRNSQAFGMLAYRWPGLVLCLWFPTWNTEYLII